MEKIDLRKQLKTYYQASATAVAEVHVPAFNFLMVDGQGDPNTSPAYAEAVEALFTVSYTAKFMVKKGPAQQDYAVMPLEGLWWADDLSAIQRLHAHIEARSTLRGRHHEIYLSDIRRADPSRWKTILRQPMG